MRLKPPVSFVNDYCGKDTRIIIKSNGEEIPRIFFLCCCRFQKKKKKNPFDPFFFIVAPFSIKRPYLRRWRHWQQQQQQQQRLPTKANEEIAAKSLFPESAAGDKIENSGRVAPSAAFSSYFFLAATAAAASESTIVMVTVRLVHILWWQISTMSSPPPNTHTPLHKTLHRTRLPLVPSSSKDYRQSSCTQKTNSANKRRSSVNN